MMYSSKTKLFPEEVLNLQPNFPKKGVTCENYITDAFQKKSFYSWDNDLKIKSSSDEKIKRFQKQSLQVGDKVRVKLANFQSAVRKELKAKNSKQIIVRFSPEIYY